jgi:hypothetical protein
VKSGRNACQLVNLPAFGRAFDDFEFTRRIAREACSPLPLSAVSRAHDAIDKPDRAEDFGQRQKRQSLYGVEHNGLFTGS